MRYGLPLCLLLLVVAGCDEDIAGAPGLVAIFGETGMGPGEFSYPRALVVGDATDVYIVDKAARIQCYSPAGEFLHDWRTPAASAGKPTGLGIDSAGRIYAADTHYARVLIYEPDGTLAETFGTQGEGPGQFIMPTDVAVAPDGTIYVSEYGGNDRVSRFSPQLEFITSFGGPDAGAARLQRPQALLVEDDGMLWVADACNHRICQFSPDGDLLFEFGASGAALGELSYPYSLDMLSDGTFVIAEYGNNRVQRFDRDGTSLGIWGSAGRKPGQLAYPWAAAVGVDDRVYVLDSGNNRVQVIEGRARRTWQSD